MYKRHAASRHSRQLSIPQRERVKKFMLFLEFLLLVLVLRPACVHRLGNGEAARVVLQHNPGQNRRRLRDGEGGKARLRGTRIVGGRVQL